MAEYKEVMNLKTNTLWPQVYYRRLVSLKTCDIENSNSTRKTENGILKKYETLCPEKSVVS